ncbi:ribonucleotide reductase subunit alpha [Chitinimonas taiwanensis]|uniref:Uncharacterized protein n=1 Tax=Chitinimonas taiwanensis DSM 18899 TaxID=1121279 RepID=A0A1K2H9M6_9NEIS|nr:ribonucleotide reductase subunit alpha [Chitinimonas taiwanensis]SFZ73443.1 hypothetical protein SAMN02745887_00827 [Chitinimonas taiwanensis DSM 18899]
MQLASFADLLQAAQQQDQPQRLLFVFAAAELPSDATPAQRARFEAGQGGALVPRMCVDKLPAELADFASLAAEAAQMGQHWQLMFAASLSGRAGQPPSSAEAEPHLNRMIEAIQQGHLQSFLAFDRQGELLMLH